MSKTCPFDGNALSRDLNTWSDAVVYCPGCGNRWFADMEPTGDNTLEAPNA